MRKGDSKVAVVKEFYGLDLDHSPERIPLGYAKDIENMVIEHESIPKRTQGCTLASGYSASQDAIKIALFNTRGEDYIFIYHSDGKVRIYKYPSFTEITYSTTYEDVDDITFTEEVWFAQHMNEMWFGNRAEGVWRWRPGHQPLMRGSAPFDILAEVAQVGDTEKPSLQWRFAYAYEQFGGISPLSRYVSVHLYSNDHTVKLTLDTPPSGSTERRIYAKYLKEDDTWSNWYKVKTITESTTTDITLDDELDSDNLDSALNEDNVMAMSPKALLATYNNGRIWLANTVNSPDEVMFSDIMQPYFPNTNTFSLDDHITNMVAYHNVIIASTNRKVFALHDEPDKMEVIADGEGAYKNSMAVANDKLIMCNELGPRVLTEKGFQRLGSDEYVATISAKSTQQVSNLNFIGLEKDPRSFLFSDQISFEEGTFNGGIDSSYIPGAISLQPNLQEVLGLEGKLDIQVNGAANYDTNTKGRAISFKIKGTADNPCTISAITLMMRSLSEQAEDTEFVCELRTDKDYGAYHAPNMDTDALASFSGYVINKSRYNRMFILDTPIEITEETLYWVYIPEQGQPGSDWEVELGSVGDYHPDMDCMTTEDDGASWSSNSYLPRIKIWGYGKILVTSNKLGDVESGEYDSWYGVGANAIKYAIKFTVNYETFDLAKGLIGFNSKTGSPNVPKITVVADSSGDPTGAEQDVGTSVTEVDNVIRFTLDTTGLSNGDYWVIFEEPDSPNDNWDASNYWSWKKAVLPESDSVKRDLGSGWDSCTSGIFSKIWIEASEGLVPFASTGNWVSPDILIESTDTFGKAYTSYMQPANTTITFYKQVTDNGGTNWYDNLTDKNEDTWEVISSFPFTIDTSADGIKFKIALDLSTGVDTPLVDSLLINYSKSGDSGDKLYAGNVNGEYWLSRDGSDAFTILYNKFNKWFKLSKEFYDYLTISEKTALGIGQNAGNSKKVYELKTGDYWFEDDMPESINSTWETGWMLFDDAFKLIRHIWLSLGAGYDNSDNPYIGNVYITIYTKDPTSNDYDDVTIVDSDESLKTSHISLPGSLQGRLCKIKFTAEHIDWRLHNIKISYIERIPRPIYVSKGLVLPTLTLLETYDATTETGESYGMTSAHFGKYDNYLYTGSWKTAIGLYKFSFDSNGLTKELWHTGDGASGICIKDFANHLYCGQNDTFRTIGKSDLKADDNVAYEGNYLVEDDINVYLGETGESGQLGHIDCADPTNISWTQMVAGVNTKGLDSDGTYLFVTNISATSSIFQIYRISDNNKMGELNLTSYLGADAKSLVYDPYREVVYVAGYSGIVVVDVSDVTNPSVNQDLDFNYSYCIIQYGKYWLFSLPYNSTNGELDIIRIINDQGHLRRETQVSTGAKYTAHNNARLSAYYMDVSNDNGYLAIADCDRNYVLLYSIT